MTWRVATRLFLAVLLLGGGIASTGSATDVPATQSEHVSGDVLATASLSTASHENTTRNSTENATYRNRSPSENSTIETPRGALQITPTPANQAGSTNSNTSQVVVVTLSQKTPEHVEAINETGATIQLISETQLQVRASESQRSLIRNFSFVTAIRDPVPIQPMGSPPRQIRSVHAEQLRDQGITGQNISVGILTGSDVDTSIPELSNHVAATKSFGGAISDTNGAGHGTAVAEIVSDTAPGSSLYISNFRTTVGYKKAVQWMREQQVDVIVMSLAFFRQPYDGTGVVSKTADEAVDAGIVWISPVGNYAQAHWQSRYRDTDGDSWINLNGQDETNLLNDGEPLAAGEAVSLSLTWNDWPQATTDYDLYLFRLTSENTSVVATSKRIQNGSQKPAESISTRVPVRGTYAFAIIANGQPVAKQLELFATDGRSLQADIATGSITAPAVAEKVLSVGAYGVRDGLREPFSSHGPTNDGRRGIDLLAPDGLSTTAYGYPFYGTSASAPVTAGAVALLLDSHPSLTPQKVKSTLRSTATDVGPEGPDEVSGFGKIDVEAATRLLKSRQVSHYTYDRRVDSGNRQWAGMRLLVHDPQMTSSEILLYRVNNGTITKLIRELTLDSNGTTTFETDTLQGRYVLTNEEGTPLVVVNGSVRQTATLDAAAFNITDQSLTLSSIRSNETQLLSINSNRSVFNLTLTWNLTRSNVERPVPPSVLSHAFEGWNTTILNKEGSTDTIMLPRVKSGTCMQFNRSALPAGTYTLSASVPSTNAQSTSTFTIETSKALFVLKPSKSQVIPGETSTISISAKSSEMTIKRYSFVLQTTDTENVSIQSVQFPDAVNAASTKIAPGILEIKVTNISNPTPDSLVTVEFSADSRGSAVFTLKNISLRTSYGSTYKSTVTESTVLISNSGLPAIVGTNSPQDIDGDGQYEDITGDGQVDVVDVQALFINHQSRSVQQYSNRFDFNNDSQVDKRDIQRLFDILEG